MIWVKSLKMRKVSLLVGACFLMGAGTATADIGAVQWQKILNADDGAWDLTTFRSVGFRSDGSILASGNCGGGLAVRYDEDTGELLDTAPQWIDYETSGTNHNYFFGQVIDSNGDIYFIGRHDGYDPGVWKYDSSASLQAGWPKIHAVTGDGDNIGVALDSSGFVYSVGYNNSDWHISKHAKSDGGAAAGFPLSFDYASLSDTANDVAVDSEDNFIVVGHVQVDANHDDWYVRKYSSEGSVLWQASYNLNDLKEDAYDVGVDSEDNIIVCGYRNNGTDEDAGKDQDWYIVKYAKDGDGSGGAAVLWEQSWNSGNGSTSRAARALLIDSADNVYVGGEENNSSNAARSYIQYRDGQTGTLIKSQELSHPETVRWTAGTAGTEYDYIGGLALNGNQLVVAGYVWEAYRLNGRTGWISMIKLPLPEVGAEDWSSTYYSPDSNYSANFLDVGFLSDGNVLATGNKPWGQGLAVRYNADTGVAMDTPTELLSESNGSGIQFRGQAFDGSGNIYFAGIELSTMKLWKYSSDGVLAWEAFDSSSIVNSYNVAVDSSGNSYTTGIKDNTASGSGWDGILSKFDASGNSVGTPFPIVYDHDGFGDGFFGVAVDSNNNVIVSGWVNVSAAVSHNDGLVQKYNSSGTLLWQRQYDGIGLNDYARRVKVDGDDNIIVVGYTNRGTSESAPGLDWDWYITKYDPDGTLLWQETWDDGTGRLGYARDLVFDEQNNLYVTGEQEDSNGMTRIHVQYRDGQTGALLKIQELSHVQTYHDNPTTEAVKESSIGIKDGKLVISAYVDDTSNPSTYDIMGVVITLDRTFVVTSSTTANGSINPVGKVDGVVYDATVAFTLTPDAEYAPASPTGTCLTGSAPTDNGDGTWLYTTGAITSDCTVEVNFTLAFAGGDINRDHSVDLVDAIIGLQILVGIEPSVPVYLSADFNDDMQIGMVEVISVFRKMVGLPFLSYDCNGDRDGTAYLDNCSTCVEGNTGQTACVADCNGDWGGTAVVDDCGVCDDNPANDNTTCVQDCAETWGGTATTDDCGVCDDDANNDNTTCTEDCNGDWGGSAYVDNCSTCVSGNTGQIACSQDCAGTWGGTATTDDCGVCDDDDTNDNTTCTQDCYGDWDGSAYLDDCSTCVGGNTGQNACTQDCVGTWGGTATTDGCGVCDDDDTNDNTTCTQDCNGDWDGSAYLDNCSICVGGTTGQSACTQDCAGTWGGTAITDSCGVCDDDNTNNNITCTEDCNGTWGGSAYLDICNGCVGGDTGYLPCGEVTSLTGRTWLDRNLGASRVATSSADSIAYGDLYQWGRLTDGHESRTSPLTYARSSSDIPGHGSFIYTGSYVLDWRVSQNDSLWQGTSGTNNPCPAGFRLPTYVELRAELNSWASSDRIGAFNSPLKLVTSGVRSYSNGYLRYVGSNGYYWSNTITPGGVNAKSYNLGFNDSASWGGVRVDARATGYSVRCIKDN